MHGKAVAECDGSLRDDSHTELDSPHSTKRCCPQRSSADDSAACNEEDAETLAEAEKLERPFGNALKKRKRCEKSPHSTLKALLKYCQEIVTNRDDSNSNVMDNVLFHGQDFTSMGLEKTNSEDWFYVDENRRGSSAMSDFEPECRDQRQLFYRLFEHHRQSKLDGGELVCGIGIARKKFVDDSVSWHGVWHPIILIHMNVEDRNGRLYLSPSRIHEPALWSMSGLCSGDDDDARKVRELEDQFREHLKQLEQQEKQLTPFMKETYLDFLHQVRRSWQGDEKSVYDKPNRDDSKDKNAYWDALKGKELQVIDEWVLFSQAGDVSNSKKDIQGFIRCLDRGLKAPPPWACFLAEKLEDVNFAPAIPKASLPESEFLFPLDSNDQQQEIANALHCTHTVVVQGPPGTGKTHTLANLVSNAVAEGKRVLVVSTGQHALEVFFAKLPSFLRSIAMFLGDGDQGKDQSQFIKGVENVRRIADESRRPGWTAQVNADSEFAQKKLSESQARKHRLDRELQARSEILLLPLSKEVLLCEGLPQELCAAAKLRETIRTKFAHAPFASYSLSALLVDSKDDISDWLEDLPEPEKLELRGLLEENVMPTLLSILKRDLYKDFKSNQQQILRYTEQLITTQIKKHIAQNSQRTPGVSTVANQFLEQLKAGQGKGRGHHARHWKLAKEILAQEQMLVKAFPLWIMTTSLVSELLPSTFGLFDVVAIDEASKSEICELPALLRGDSVLIIGDNKQVSPNDLALKERRLHELDQKRKGITFSIALQCTFEPGKSIFDLFHGFHIDNVKILREHFRCTQAIIKFCNDNFYEGELEPLRMSTRGKRLIPQIKCNSNPLLDIGEADADLDVLALEKQQNLEILRKQLEGYKMDQLKTECKDRKLAVSGAKQILINRIIDCEGRAEGKRSTDSITPDDEIVQEVKRIVSNPDEGIETFPDGRQEERKIGVIVLGVGQEPENMSKRLHKRIKQLIEDTDYKKYQIRCGGPADFQGDEKDIVLALLPSRQLTNNINIPRWDQAINVAVSRARERFHLFHRIEPEGIKCSDNDPRGKLVRYCEDFVKRYSARLAAPQTSRLEGFAKEVMEALVALGIEVRTCDEILPPEWRDKMLAVEGEKRMVAVVLNGGERQTVELWREENKKWAVLSRVEWRIVELWRFQFSAGREVFMENLLAVLKEEGVQPQPRLAPPDIACKAPSGGEEPFVELPITVTLRPPDGARAYYTLDGSAPSRTSLRYRSDRPLLLRNLRTTIRAIAVRDGYPDSEAAVRTVQVRIRVQEPVFVEADRGDGTYAGGRLAVQLKCATPGAEIWYTDDGTAPMPDGHKVCTEAGFELVCDGVVGAAAGNGVGARTFEVRAMAVLPPTHAEYGNMLDSVVVTHRFEVRPPSPPTADPELRTEFAEGPWVGSVRVLISCITPGAAIFYTTDGSSPAQGSSTRYDAADGVVVNDSDAVVRAVAIAPSRLPSRVQELGPFSIRAVTPQLAPVSGDYEDMVTVELMRSPIDGTVVHFTLDGRTPTADASVYTEPIRVTETGTVVRAIARRAGQVDSEEFSAGPFVVRARPPAFEPDGGVLPAGGTVHVAIRSRVSGAIIYYTLDGSVPIPPESPDSFESSLQYTAPVIVDSRIRVIRAVAVCKGKATSTIAQSLPYHVETSHPACGAGIGIAAASPAMAAAPARRLEGGKFHGGDGAGGSGSNSASRGGSTVTKAETPEKSCKEPDEVTTRGEDRGGGGGSSGLRLLYRRGADDVDPPEEICVPDSGRRDGGQRRFIIGRSEECDFRVSDDRVSWQHCALVLTAGSLGGARGCGRVEVLLETCSETKSTFVICAGDSDRKEVPPCQTRQLQHGDVIGLRRLNGMLFQRFEILLPAHAERTKTQPDLEDEAETLPAAISGNKLGQMSATEEGVRGSERSVPAATAAAAVAASKPLFEPDGGDFPGPVDVVIRCPQPGVAIHYTLDGSTPGPASPLYSAPVRVSADGTQLRAVAMVNSGRTVGRLSESNPFRFWWCRLVPLPEPAESGRGGSEIQVGLEHADFVFGRRVVNRAPGSFVVVDHPLVSRKHCALERVVGDGVVLRCFSANGAFVNRRKVAPPKAAIGTTADGNSEVMVVRSGDTIALVVDQRVEVGADGKQRVVSDPSVGEQHAYRILFPTPKPESNMVSTPPR